MQICGKTLVMLLAKKKISKFRRVFNGEKDLATLSGNVSLTRFKGNLSCQKKRIILYNGLLCGICYIEQQC